MTQEELHEKAIIAFDMELQKWPTNQMDKLADLLSILAVVGTTSSDGLSEILKRIDNALVLKGR